MGLIVEIGELTVNVNGGNVAFSAPLQVKDDADGSIYAETTYQTQWYDSADPNTPQNRDDAFAYAANEWFQQMVAQKKVQDQFLDARDSIAARLRETKPPVLGDLGGGVPKVG